MDDAVSQWPAVMLLFASGFLLGRGFFSSSVKPYERPLAILFPISLALAQATTLLGLPFRGVAASTAIGLVALGWILTTVRKRRAEKA